MRLDQLIPDVEQLINLAPEELGFRILQTFPEFSLYSVPNLRTYIEWLLHIRTGTQQYQLKTEIIENAICEAWQWLESQVLLVKADVNNLDHRKLSRRGIELANAPEPVKVHALGLLAKERLHDALQEDVWTFFHRGKYDTAVFEAMRHVEVSVRKAGNFPDTDIGTALMRNAFHSTNGPLTDMKSATAEREALSSLFAGAIGCYKNPRSHRHVGLNDPVEAAEIIMLASHLLNIVDARKLKE